jgi:hypothetical protein
MAHLELSAGIVERARYGDALDGLASDLAAAGWTVIEPRERYEERSGGGAMLHEVIAVALHLSQEVGHDALGVLVGMVIARLRRPKPKDDPHPPRVAVIYDARGHELKRVSLDD